MPKQLANFDTDELLQSSRFYYLWRFCFWNEPNLVECLSMRNSRDTHCSFTAYSGTFICDKIHPFDYLQEEGVLLHCSIRFVERRLGRSNCSLFGFFVNRNLYEFRLFLVFIFLSNFRFIDCEQMEKIFFNPNSHSENR